MKPTRPSAPAQFSGGHGAAFGALHVKAAALCLVKVPAWRRQLAQHVGQIDQAISTRCRTLFFDCHWSYTPSKVVPSTSLHCCSTSDGHTITLTFPVSSSSVRSRKPLAVPGHCRRHYLSPATERLLLAESGQSWLNHSLSALEITPATCFAKPVIVPPKLPKVTVVHMLAPILCFTTTIARQCSRQSAWPRKIDVDGQSPIV